LLVPYQLVTDFLPRLAKGVQFDAVRGELRAPATLAGTATSPAARPPASAPRKRVVVVDAGHGGEHPGMRAVLANGRVVYEKVITLGIARKLEAALSERGFQVVMTRDRDTLISLVDRGEIANRANGDIFLSIHVNANGPSGSAATRGFETYFLAEALTEDAKRVEAMENEVIRADGSRGSETEGLAFIFSDMVQNEHLRASSELAETIQRGIQARRHPGPDRGVKQAKFLVLVSAFMPAVLIETGYGTNKSEAAWLASEVGQSTLANAIANAAVAYFKDYDRRMGADQP
jgi:N-acetylmuramoyl-L-alanine amidase